MRWFSERSGGGVRSGIVRYSRHGSVFAAHEVAQNVVEYGLLLATIGIVVVLGANAFGAMLGPWFQHLAASIVTTGT